MELPVATILFSASFVLLAVYIISYWASYVPVRKDSLPMPKNSDSAKLPAFSVIIVTHDSDSLLERLVNRLVAQHYPAFEILIVNNASTDNTGDVIKRASFEHPSIVRHTFLPQNKNGVLHMSMATTLGIRAARNEWVVLLKPTSLPKSDFWLASIARAISGGAEICIGYNDYFGYDNSKWVRKAIKKRRKAQLLNYRAVFRGKCRPVECEGSNIAFSKTDFFRNGGYGSWLALRDCHENLYVATYSKKNKTAFLTGSESQVETVLPPIEELWDIERRHALKSYKKLSVATKLRRNHYAMLSLVYLLSLVCMALGVCFTFCPPAFGDSLSVIRVFACPPDYFAIPMSSTMSVIVALLFVIVSLTHYFCVLFFRRRDHKRLYAPLSTNPAEIMTI